MTFDTTTVLVTTPDTPVKVLAILGSAGQTTILNGSSTDVVYVGTVPNIAAAGQNTAVIPPYGIALLSEVYSNKPLYAVAHTVTASIPVSVIQTERDTQ